MKNIMKLIMLPLCLPALTSSCAGNHSGKADTIRLMTYNVGVFGKYSEDSAPEIASMIKELDANTCTLNELDSCNSRHDAYQAKYLAECLGDGWDYAFGRAIAFRGGAYGEGLVTRDTVLNRYSIVLPQGDGAEQRVCVVVEADRYVFAATHLDHVSEAAAMAQASIITSSLKDTYGKSGKPVFLCGDMNSTPDSKVMQTMFKDWRNLSGTALTYPSRKPEICIDYILMLDNGADAEVLDSRVCTSFASGNVEDASDHLPVYVELRLK